jgi:hypothetical protein
MDIKAYTTIIPFVAFYGCETWPVALKEGYKLRGD